MKVNWKIRFQSKTFVVALLALVLTLANQFAEIFGADITIITQEITHLSETILMILSLVGIVHDPTTPTLSDSQRVLSKERLQ